MFTVLCAFVDVWYTIPRVVYVLSVAMSAYQCHVFSCSVKVCVAVSGELILLSKMLQANGLRCFYDMQSSWILH